MAYGENGASVHAERAAIANLPPRRCKRHLKAVHLVVIRTTRTGRLASSRPCAHCVAAMALLLPARGYRLDRVTYSDASGALVTTKLVDLARDEPHMSRGNRPMPSTALKNL